MKAIEDGRFDALPRGIYARAAVRTYAAAIGLDPDEILDACAASLPQIDEPIAAMCRLRGVSHRPDEKKGDAADATFADEPVARALDWRLPGAAAIDACVVGGMLAALMTIARVATAVPVATLGARGAIAFAVMGLLMGTAYFAWFGGLVGTTAGARVLGVSAIASRTSRVTLGVVTARAARRATDDLRFVAASGAHVRQVWHSMLIGPRDLSRHLS